MTDARLQLDVVTPEGVVVATEVDEVVAPGPAGEFGVLPGHTPFLVLLDVGEVRYQSERGEERLSVAHGFAEVTPIGLSFWLRAASGRTKSTWSGLEPP